MCKVIIIERKLSACPYLASESTQPKIPIVQKHIASMYVLKGVDIGGYENKPIFQINRDA